MRIRHPGDLRRVLARVRPLVEGGVLAERPSPRGFTRPPFLTVPLQGPWDDLLAFDFECTACGRRFTLDAETYHGSGGAWGVGPTAWPASIDDLVRSHRALAEAEVLIRGAVPGLLPKRPGNPFVPWDAPGRFLHVSNRTARYTTVYDGATDPGELIGRCTIQVGYATLFVLEQVALFEGPAPIVLAEAPSAPETRHRGPYVVLLDPCAKLHGASNADRLFVTDDVDAARHVAAEARDATGATTLVVRQLADAYWH